MTKGVILVVVAFLWGCQDKSPTDFSVQPTEGIQYGSSVIKLPGLALAKIAAGKITYKFTLTITGDHMEPMTFSWPVDGSGGSFAIDRIPAGKSRMFKGILYGPNGAIYEGIAYVDIYPEKVAYVSLVLRRSGSAQVEVIIEDFEHDDIVGCYSLEGKADTVDFSDLVMNIMELTDSSLFVYFYRGNEMVGKFYGTLSDKTRMSGEFVIPNLFEGYLDAYLSSDYQDFKGEVFSIKDHTYPIGIMYGKRTSCDTIVPPRKCFYDTLGFSGDTLCQDTSTLIKEASIVCNRGMATLSNYTFQFACDSTTADAFSAICFECCTSQ